MHRIFNRPKSQERDLDILSSVDTRGIISRRELMRRARLVPPQVVALGAELGMDPLPLSVDELVAALRIPELV